MAPADLVSCEGPLFDLQTATLLLCPHVVETEGHGSLVSYKASIPSWGPALTAPPNPDCLHRPHNTKGLSAGAITLGLQAFNMRILRGHIQPITPSIWKFTFWESEHCSTINWKIILRRILKDFSEGFLQCGPNILFLASFVLNLKQYVPPWGQDMMAEWFQCPSKSSQRFLWQHKNSIPNCSPSMNKINFVWIYNLMLALGSRHHV